MKDKIQEVIHQWFLVQEQTYRPPFRELEREVYSVDMDGEFHIDGLFHLRDLAAKIEHALPALIEQENIDAARGLLGNVIQNIERSSAVVPADFYRDTILRFLRNAEQLLGGPLE